jgi:hypothetical protein
MARAANKIAVYLEVGQKRTFAGALDWPGWCRSGPEEAAALQVLIDYAPRYARLLHTARLGFKAPKDVSALVVRERLRGNATTDFGAPGAAPSFDTKPVDSEEFRRLAKILKAGWRIFDQALEMAAGKMLRTGPRGGGRQLDGILEHVLDSDAGYINQVGWKFKQDSTVDLDSQLEQTRQATLRALEASAHGEIPARGPRGGVRWTARYFVRRIAWHVLDHAWEIEDRVISS